MHYLISSLNPYLHPCLLERTLQSFDLKIDSLPPEALTLICNQLPWKDKLAVRGISTKFRDLPIEPITLIIFRMEQKENSFCFGLGIRLKREQKVIEIVKDPQEEGYTVTKAEVYSGIKSQTYQKTTICCDRKNYDQFINLYMKHFLSAAIGNKIEMIKQQESNTTNNENEIMIKSASDLQYAN